MTRGAALVVAGYAVAAVPALRLRASLGGDDGEALPLLAAVEAGQVLVATGHALQGHRLRALLNAAAALGIAGLWWTRATRPA